MVVSEAPLARRMDAHRVFESRYCVSPLPPQTLPEGPARHTALCPLSLSLEHLGRRIEMI